MKELVKNDFNKLSLLLQQVKKKEFIDKKAKNHFSVKKIHSNKVSYITFYKPISKIL